MFLHRLQLIQLKQLQQQHEEAVQQSANLSQQLAAIQAAMQQQHSLVQQVEGSLEQGVLMSAECIDPWMPQVWKASTFGHPSALVHAT